MGLSTEPRAPSRHPVGSRSRESCSCTVLSSVTSALSGSVWAGGGMRGWSWVAVSRIVFVYSPVICHLRLVGLGSDVGRGSSTPPRSRPASMALLAVDLGGQALEDLVDRSLVHEDFVERIVQRCLCLVGVGRV